MFTISCEQFLLAKDDDAPEGVTMIYVQNFTPVPVGRPDGQPGMLQIGTMAVALVLDEEKRQQLHELTAPPGVGSEVVGDPRPEGAAWHRCGRLQEHPSHVWLQGNGEANGDPERVEDLVWCDGRPPFASDGFDRSPDATVAP